MEVSLSGFRPEPEESFSKHWGFDSVRSAMASAGSGQASDLRQFSSPRHNQRQTSTCVAQSVIKAAEIKRIMKHGQDAHVDLSRLALYFLARELMVPQETDRDAGTHVSLAADAIRRFGVCRETSNGPEDKAFWPFDESLIMKPPPWLAMREAYLNKIQSWYAIHGSGASRVEDAITALAAGNPVAYGTQVGSDWDGYDGRIIGVPTTSRGGHATCLVGWDPAGGFFWGENSWGNDWGPYDGFNKISPDAVAASSSSDFIVICAGYEPWVPKAALGEKHDQASVPDCTPYRFGGMPPVRTEPPEGHRRLSGRLRTPEGHEVSGGGRPSQRDHLQEVLRGYPKQRAFSQTFMRPQGEDVRRVQVNLPVEFSFLYY